MSQSDITWKSPFPINPYKGETLLSVLVKDKGFLQWCYKKELHLQYAEIEWIFNNLKPHELKAITGHG